MEKQISTESKASQNIILQWLSYAAFSQKRKLDIPSAQRQKMYGRIDDLMIDWCWYLGE